MALNSRWDPLSPGRLPSLDGWRAVSILLVLGAHEVFTAGFPPALIGPFHWLFDGNLGVRFFFTISGFLITWLFLQEWEGTRNINLRHFYIRRALRILPVYGAFLLVVLVLSHADRAYDNQHSWLACLTFTRNVFGFDVITKHFWSLSIEEQFYLVWPTLLLLLLRLSHLKTILTTLFLIILMAPAVHGLIYLNICPDYPAAAVPHTLAGKAAFYPVIIASKFFCFTDTLAFGCLGAVLLAWCPAQVASTLTRRSWLPALAGLACILVPYIPERMAGTETVDHPAILVEFGNTLQAAGFTILLLQSILLPAAGLYRALNWKPVVQIGVLSYSIYIWQQMFVPCPWPRLYAVWWAGPWLLLLLLAAATSYWAMELPLLKLRNAFRPKPAPPAA